MFKAGDFVAHDTTIAYVSSMDKQHGAVLQTYGPIRQGVFGITSQSLSYHDAMTQWSKVTPRKLNKAVRTNSAVADLMQCINHGLFCKITKIKRAESGTDSEHIAWP